MASNYSAGHFELAIDGHTTTAYLRSVDGGFAKAAGVEGGFGSDLMGVKNGGAIEIDPITIDIGMSGAGGVLKWIQQSWRKDSGTRNGQITHADFNLDATYEHQFWDAHILETSFPTLDGSSKEAAYMKVKFLPYQIETAPVDGGYKIGSRIPGKQKTWLPSCFRLTIDGINGMQHVNHIDGFTIRQEVKKFYVGAERWPMLVPAAMKFPKLSCTMGAAFANDVLKWHEKVNSKGENEATAQTTGSLEFLAPNKSTVLFRLNLYEVRITDAKFVQANANADQIKRVKFDLIVGNMDLDADGALGLE